ncbi:3b288a8e-4285-4802-bdd6-8b3f1d7911ff [Thermothielavioides terrestris]|uniref:3b288a8e-4285-4802-bdd6-8b3f1d7911ff n=1 Tax=Thermothielavioides terrestris TaxID=2587410 RepID=A0A3S4DA06_9PEZI|nr:3b288a8e-4285-4802-bdd6-8b3f1d7911ff [Thermothielavioides terrestris]
MAPAVPRMHVFEIADFPWFPGFLRGYVQAGLTAAWTTHVPFLQPSSPAQVVARLLVTHLPNLHSYTFIDFCAGGGGPTPSIEQHLNQSLLPAAASAAQDQNHHHKQQQPRQKPVQFVLTDLHPHTDLWAQAAARSSNLAYEREPVDAARVPRALLARHARGGKKVFRLFNLAFHHFDDGLARRILKDTLDGGGDGFGIFELQDRSIAGFVACCLFGLGVFVMAPYYALLWGAPLALLFTYVVPILPFVLVFDGWMSCLRTRTPDEVVALLRTCGAEGGEAEIQKWEVKSGREEFMWPVGSVHWIICVKR